MVLVEKRKSVQFVVQVWTAKGWSGVGKKNKSEPCDDKSRWQHAWNKHENDAPDGLTNVSKWKCPCWHVQNQMLPKIKTNPLNDCKFQKTLEKHTWQYLYLSTYAKPVMSFYNLHSLKQPNRASGISTRCSAEDFHPSRPSLQNLQTTKQLPVSQARSLFTKLARLQRGFPQTGLVIQWRGGHPIWSREFRSRQSLPAAAPPRCLPRHVLSCRSGWNAKTL